MCLQVCALARVRVNERHQFSLYTICRPTTNVVFYNYLYDIFCQVNSIKIIHIINP